jgi:hypothetical protein
MQRRRRSRDLPIADGPRRATAARAGRASGPNPEGATAAHAVVPPVTADPLTPGDPSGAPPLEGAAPDGSGPDDLPNGVLRTAGERLVAELRDECSDIGVSARGFDFDGLLRGVRAFAREARRLGAPAERMLVLLKRCLADGRLPREDRDVYQQYHDAAMTAAIVTYYGAAADADAGADADPPPVRDARPDA